MKNESIRNKELLLLSAYLDNELPTSQRQSLEQRLLNEPDLRRKFDDLRKTKTVLGNLTRLQAPRNFTLTPEMVKVRRKKQVSWFSTLKLATSLAAILLVVLFGVELFIQQGFLGGTQIAMESAPQTESLKTMDEETPQPLIYWSEPGIGGGGAGVSEELAEDSETLSESPKIDDERSSEESEIFEEPTGGGGEENMEAESEQPSEEQAITLEEESPTDQDKDLILGLNPDSEGEIIAQSEPDTTVSRTSQRMLSVFNWLQIAFALFILFGGITIWIFRSKKIF